MHMQTLTLSAVVSAASLHEVVAEGLRPFDGMVASAHSLGIAACWVGAAVTTDALATEALSFIMSGEAATALSAV